MSVTLSVPLRFLPYSGYTDPRLPLYHWISSGLSTGDGTGGEHRVRTILSSSLASRIQTGMFNVEQVSIQNSSLSGLNVNLNTDNIGDESGGAGIDINVALQLTTLTATGFGVAALGREYDLFPLWLGQPFVAGADAFIQAVVANVNAQTFRVMMWGYAWGIRSRNQDGGPQRPLTGRWR